MAKSLLLLCVYLTSSWAASPHDRYPPLPIYPHKAEPYKKSYCDPTKPPLCAYNNTNYCLEDPEYPLYEIKSIIEEDYLFSKKYADIADQSADDLVDKVTAEQESYFDYTFYTGASKGHTPYDITHWGGPEGYICPSHVGHIQPKRAKNVEGHWRVIINGVHYYTQTARIEACLYPDSACRLIAPCYNSKCSQKFVYHRLLSYDPCEPYKGLFIDIYRFPSACSCHIKHY